MTISKAKRSIVQSALDDPAEFSRAMWPRKQMRPYQAAVAREIARSIERGEGTAVRGCLRPPIG